MFLTSFISWGLWNFPSFIILSSAESSEPSKILHLCVAEISGSLSTQNHGGILVHHSLKVKIIPLPDQALCLLYAAACFLLMLLSFYRPGSCAPSLAFYTEFSSMLQLFKDLQPSTHHHLWPKYLNIQLEDPSSPDTARFNNLIQQFGLTQHVAETTHYFGGWLYLVITRDDCIVQDLMIEPSFLFYS